jgi:hypothetical protein
VAELYVSFIGSAPAVTTLAEFRGANLMSGATIYNMGTTASAGTSVFGSAWVPCNYAGDFGVYSTAAINDITIQILGARLR